jgi:hypothetical protein
VNKKKQKNFIRWRTAIVRQRIKFFARFFPKKRCFL